MGQNNSDFGMEIDEMLNLWKENGVDIEKSYSLLVKFYHSSGDSPEEFIAMLEQEGYGVQAKSSRTLLIFKGWEIFVERTENWTEIQS